MEPAKTDKVVPSRDLLTSVPRLLQPTPIRASPFTLLNSLLGGLSSTSRLGDCATRSSLGDATRSSDNPLSSIGLRVASNDSDEHSTSLLRRHIPGNDSDRSLSSTSYLGAQLRSSLGGCTGVSPQSQFTRTAFRSIYNYKNETQQNTEMSVKIDPTNDNSEDKPIDVIAKEHSSRQARQTRLRQPSSLKRAENVVTGKKAQDNQSATTYKLSRLKKHSVASPANLKNAVSSVVKQAGVASSSKVSAKLAAQQRKHPCTNKKKTAAISADEQILLGTYTVRQRREKIAKWLERRLNRSMKKIVCRSIFSK
jgi:hypothetical protein